MIADLGLSGLDAGVIAGVIATISGAILAWRRFGVDRDSVIISNDKGKQNLLQGIIDALQEDREHWMGQVEVLRQRVEEIEEDLERIREERDQARREVEIEKQLRVKLESRVEELEAEVDRLRNPPQAPG